MEIEIDLPVTDIVDFFVYFLTGFTVLATPCFWRPEVWGIRQFGADQDPRIRTSD
jgi:hypothetical protein